MTVTANALTRPSVVNDATINRLTSMIVSTSGRTYNHTEVYTGETITALPQSSPEDVASAFTEARKAQQIWASWSLKKRMGVLNAFHGLLIENYETVVDLMQVETGKARRMAFEEVCDVLMTTSHYLKVAPRVLKERKHGGVVPIVSNSTEVHVPKGVVALISPWNFPFAISLSDQMPALLAGNGVVLKPDNKSTLCVSFGIELLYKAGVPKGLIQIVCGEGPDIGPAIVENADFVMFTGSTATGRVIGALAGQNLIDCTLELGGKNPLIVLEDANMEETVAGAMFGTFLNAGQACMHIERIYVPRNLEAEFTKKFVAEVEKLRVGAAYDYAPQMGGLISEVALNRVQSHVDDAVEKGATVLTGGKARPDLGPTFFEPTVLTGVTKDMLHSTVETFGPVVTIYPYDSVDQAVELANDTDYGLNASIWGSDLKKAEAVGRRIQSGGININDGLACSYASKATPSGGFKNSGVGARHGDYGLLKYTDMQNVAVLKKQVLTTPDDKPYGDIIKKNLQGMAFMRKFKIR
jgi:aldehyde dehydrogenase (NAD+)/succinate-semialdehyde dehydrogenase/glutarate-semialdehyde dehydrogenase